MLQACRLQSPACRFKLFPTLCMTQTFPTGLEKFTDRQGKIIDWTVCFPAQSVCHHIQSGSLYLEQARHVIQTGLLC